MCSCGTSRKRYILCCVLLSVVAILLILGVYVARTLVPQLDNVLFQNKCIEDLGCFYNGPPFYDPLNRPISFAPSDQVKTKFLLFTPTYPDTGEEIESTEFSILDSFFDPLLPVKVIIHGYMSDMDMGDIQFKMKDALLNNSTYNIIIVNWTDSSCLPYPQAVANARVVGAQLAKLLTITMEAANVRAQDIHIIGHSLGAHIAGWTGERIENIGRITGLDPAGLYFQEAENSLRLDTTDALFVDVIHTDGDRNFVQGLGLSDPIGHIDFYPNGGKKQPGCVYEADSTSSFAGVINYASKWLSNKCDHKRANEYFLESISNSKCRFLAVQCNSYSDFEKGGCLPQNSTISEMGCHTKQVQGVPTNKKFFLRTESSSPFCIENSIYL